ncbi:uncharacterized protein [Procambarus clarkii]|uniref:uncharacterized protein isoform X2 n=1 Tax=Procambarus clarkii TaxID=6728 RepID=UPI003742BB07
MIPGDSRVMERGDALRCPPPGHKTMKKWRVCTAECFLHLMLLFALLLGVSSQLTSEAPPTEEDSDEQQIHQLVIDTPCLPCYREEVVGCKKVFGCIVNADNSISSIFFSSPAAVGDSGKRSEKARISPPSEASPCLPCHYRDWYNRCRKIRSCIPDSDAPDVATFPPESDAEEGFEGEEPFSSDGEAEGSQAASDANGAPPSSYEDSTRTSPASATSGPPVEPTTSEASTNFLLFDVPAFRAAAPRASPTEPTPPDDASNRANTTSSFDTSTAPQSLTPAVL